MRKAEVAKESGAHLPHTRLTRTRAARGPPQVSKASLELLEKNDSRPEKLFEGYAKGLSTWTSRFHLLGLALNTDPAPTINRRTTSLSCC